MKHECIIGMFYNYEDTRLVTLSDIKQEIQSQENLKRYELETIGQILMFKDVYTLEQYTDKRVSTDLTHFTYCPMCGKKINLKNMTD